jgi:hypothetical protein
MQQAMAARFEALAKPYGRFFASFGLGPRLRK